MLCGLNKEGEEGSQRSEVIEAERKSQWLSVGVTERGRETSDNDKVIKNQLYQDA